MKTTILLSLPKTKLPECREVLWLTMLFSIMVSMLVHADTQRITDYVYDGAGNIISVRSGLNFGSPDVTNLSPAFIHKDSFAFVTATGVNLLKAVVSTSTPGLNIVTIEHISATEIFIALFANNSATVGPGLLTFTTRLGSDTETITIADRTPIISTDPNPILLLPDNQPRQVNLLFDQPFDTEQVFDVLIRNSSIASLAEQSITLATGQRNVSINLSGIKTGSTSLEINQLSNLLALAIPVIVSDPFQLPSGNLYISSNPLGIKVSRFDLPSGNNKITSNPLVVVRNSFDLPSGNSNTISNPLIVVRNSFDLPTGQNQIISDALGVTLEPVADQVIPSQVSTGTSNTLTITGAALGSVTFVSFELGTGITQSAPFSVGPLGTELTIFIDVASNATAGLRQIILTTANGNVAFSVAGGDILEIAP